jgi:hypothetical protein
LSANDSVALRGPVALGEKTINTAQVPSTLTVARQVLELMEKSEAFVPVMPTLKDLRLALPTLASLTPVEELGWPTGWEPKFKEPEESWTTGLDPEAEPARLMLWERPAVSDTVIVAD